LNGLDDRSRFRIEEPVLELTLGPGAGSAG
jgi:hypothetical protein